MGAGISYQNNGTISHCINNGSVSGVDRVAGIVSENTSLGKVISCINTGKITATNSGINIFFTGVAGIVVTSQFGSIFNCINLGNVEGQDYVSGIQVDAVGTALNPSLITNCINAGYVKGNKYVGGILAVMSYSFPPDVNVIITNCVNVGVVEGNEDVGSIVGKE
jgi:ABC-type Co2+ transport system permease subunit